MDRSSIVLGFLLVGLLFSCSPDQQGDFQDVSEDKVPAGKAVVYLYRPPSITSFGLCNVELNVEVVGALHPGQYTVCFVSPGKTRIAAAEPHRAFITVNVSAPNQYFIRQTWVLSSTGVNPVIEHMTGIKAQTEIGRCLFVKTPPVIDTTDSKEDDGGEAEPGPFF
jgi:hypothetical protein